jgi:LmbE family N-acetylglucosaminyl deacetylase
VNILVVSAHHDDLELGCGGTVARMVEKGHRVVSLVMTHSGYKNAEGVEVRSRERAGREASAAAGVLGYQLITEDEDTFDIAVKDFNICKVLNVINTYQIDTLFTHWHGDTHPPHQSVHTMALHAARRVPRVFGFAVNWHMGSQAFAPQVFVPLTEAHWERKIKALQCYATEYERAGRQWFDYLNHQTRNYGTQLGVPRAEGFMTYKSLWEF